MPPFKLYASIFDRGDARYLHQCSDWSVWLYLAGAELVGIYLIQLLYSSRPPSWHPNHIVYYQRAPS